MPTTGSSGHPGNISKFEELIASCTGYGATYNPSNNNLKVAQLQTVQTASKNALQTVKTTKTTYDNACNAREIAMAPLKKFCTRIINAIDATAATKQTIDDVKSINHKIQGKSANGSKAAKAAPVTTDVAVAEPQPAPISTSQQSIDSLIDNFQKLIVALTAEPLYVPNEADLKVAALNTTLTTLKTLNTAAINASIQYSNAMIARDTTMYQPNTGLVPVALEVKKYVKSVYGATSPQYKQISGLEFKNLSKN